MSATVQRILIVCLLCVAFSAVAGENLRTGVLAQAPHPEETAPFPKVRVSYLDFPPFTYTNESGRAAGTVNELTRQVLTAADIPHEFLEFPPKRIVRYMRTGEVDGFQGMAPSLADGTVLISKTELEPLQLMLYHLPGTPPKDRYEDLKGASVVTLLGYAYGPAGVFLEDPENQISNLQVHGRESAIAVLERGRADYFLDYRAAATLELGEERLQKLVQCHLLTMATHWVVRKSHLRAEQLIEVLDTTYRHLSETAAAEGGPAGESSTPGGI